jgi:hypothetical protein
MSERLPLTPLCRFAGHTCAACCWGENVSSAALKGRLRRQSRVFDRCFGERSRLGRLELLGYQLRIHGIEDLFLGILLILPLLGDLLRPWLSRRLVCAFLGYEDDNGERVGCMLHPSRWGGSDLRAQSAFALLKGVGCGAPSWYCLSAHFFAAASRRERQRLRQAGEGLNWYAYSRLAARYRPPHP